MLSYASERTPAKTSESLEEELQAVNRELTFMKKKWQEELGENVILKEAANRLNLQMQDIKELAEQKERRHEKARSGVLYVWPFPSSSNAFANLVEFTGTGRGETGNRRSGRESQSRARPFAGPLS
jgi:hypothetical protein